MYRAAGRAAKPDPASMQDALDRLKYDASGGGGVLVIGDSPADFEAASALAASRTPVEECQATPTPLDCAAYAQRWCTYAISF